MFSPLRHLRKLAKFFESNDLILPILYGTKCVPLEMQWLQEIGPVTLTICAKMEALFDDAQSCSG